MAVEWHPEKFNKKLQADNERRMLDSVLIVENRAKRDAPKKTSRMASTIMHLLELGEQLKGRVRAGGKAYDGTNVYYAIYQELGTKYMPGRFFMRGALRKSYSEIRRIWGIK
jgi:HK97 gp10 family phage protein